MGSDNAAVAMPYVGERIADAFQKDRNILISEPITRELAMRVMLLLRTMEAEDEAEPIRLIIDSPGGEVQAGWIIYDSMNVCRCPIITVCYGEAASIAAVIFANGGRGRRYMLEHAKVMIHQPWSAIRGLAVKESDLADASSDLTRTRREIENAIAKASGRTLSEVHAACERDCRMDADEAISFGLADAIL